MDNAALVHPQIPGFLHRFELRRQRGLRNLWRRRASILIWLLEHTLVFLIITRVSWACETADDIETSLMVLGTVASSFFRQSRRWRSNSTGQEVAYKLLKGCIWPAIYIFTLQFGLAMYLDDESL